MSSCYSGSGSPAMIAKRSGSSFAIIVNITPAGQSSHCSCACSHFTPTMIIAAFFRDGTNSLVNVSCNAGAINRNMVLSNWISSGFVSIMLLFSRPRQVLREHPAVWQVLGATYFLFSEFFLSWSRISCLCEQYAFFEQHRRSPL